MFNQIYKGKNVFITGHTGFKGSWLALWLKHLGANVTGFSLPPANSPNHFDLLHLDIASLFGDIRKPQDLSTAMGTHGPDIVFHLAAQPLVRYSYLHPQKTFETNVLGTVNVFEACRKTPGVKAIVNITSDKCYENREMIWGYRETDPMGGRDPYSCSKGCAELVTASYRDSFFSKGDSKILVASARAGNVVGGGDWADDRLVPDVMKAAASKKTALIRNPRNTRPWQHVLEPLSGYLQLGQQLLGEKTDAAIAWNFGPGEDGNREVLDVVSVLQQHWPSVNYRIFADAKKPYEAIFLKLDSSRARTGLKWRPVWGFYEAIEKTAVWYRKYYENNTVSTYRQIEEYFRAAETKNLPWVQ